MATLPLLKTGAVMQYPATKALRFSNQVIRFVDGSEQRYRGSQAPLRRWVIRLDLLDEAELAAFEEFIVTQEGSFGSFSFIDPWDGITYPDCSLDQEAFELELLDELRASTILIVRENRS